jgi:ribosomal protein L11 methyltransferase
MSEPRYPYLHLDVSPDAIELVSSKLFDLGALGIEERDGSTLTRGHGPTTLVASFEDEASALAAQAELAPEHAARLEFVVGDAWREGWRACSTSAPAAGSWRSRRSCSALRTSTRSTPIRWR